MYKMFSLASAGAVIALTITTTVFTNNQAEASAAQCGKASWYALHSRTASGEMMNPAKLTAAHKTLPFGTKLKVTNRNNGKSVIVRINDRGPFIKGRIVDLSKAAASQIGMIKSGHAPICFQRIS
ncbi:septal ring lytic transglycosylase RlpA family protein [Ahrensia kielensis]|uniref:septal ring lytic transglycosylase RlpA family protein n=1 Tax=Ahrensia kielensis TaxID=76980 RepID=UPI00037501BB